VAVSCVAPNRRGNRHGREHGQRCSTRPAGAASLGVGVAAGQGNWSVFATYGAQIFGNWQEQEVDSGCG
jgi:hypothetical protein